MVIDVFQVNSRYTSKDDNKEREEKLGTNGETWMALGLKDVESV